MEITITDTARDALLGVLQAETANTAYLAVESGGCGGNSYRITAGARHVGSGDQLYPLAYRGSQDGLTLSAALVVPAAYVDLLAGLEMNFTAGAFSFANPQAAATCNCGQSFSLTNPVVSCTPKV